ncbi:GNAT family N-acetyltransferase [uncultured Sulfitobacter sp.]|uniref:GNAT family N-acetyltransferase n=1 Tax=uncultured Sulfitobacter sp. TaxID=191468 RepID=UPI00262FBBDE|nr:GNAT family N-acetyltransferase [uncultured Sulfitobacter sp.]
MTTAPTLTTDRLTLRPHVMADFAPLYALFGSARARFMDGPFSPKQMWYWIASEVGSWSLQGFGSWGIERRSDGAFMGQLGINKPHHFPEVEMGWVLLEDFEGQGYAAEAARAGLDWAWANGHDTLVSYIDRQNTRSIALATKLGAVQDPNAALPDGDTHSDTFVYRHRRAG